MIGCQQLYDKLSKCIFYQKKIHYLGHIISSDGILVDPENIETIRGWPMKINVIGFISFIGLADFY
jgi:hypothetical protein